jgi:hypothetical protein
MATHDPNAGKRTVQRAWDQIVHKADPDLRKEKRNEVEYEFRGKRRIFRARDSSKRGAYADE